MGILAKQTVRNTLLAYVGLILGFFNVAILYPQILAEDEFGLTRLLVSMATIAGACAQFGMDNTVVRYFPYFRDGSRRNNGLLTLMLVVALAGAFLAMLVLAVLHPFFTGIFGDKNGLYSAFGLYALPLVLAEVFFLVLRGYSRSLHRTVTPTFLREFLLRVLQTLLIGAQAVWNFPFGTFMMLFTCTFLACTLFLAFDMWKQGERLVRWGLVRAPHRLKRSMVRYSAYTLVASMASIVLGSLDQLMIGALLGKEALMQVGYYAVAFNFGSVVSAPMRALGQLGIPLLADAWKRRDTATIQRIYGSTVSAQFTIGGFLFLLIWLNLGDLFTYLPPTFHVAFHTALIISLASLVNMAVGLSSGIITMSQDFRFDSASSLVLIALNAVLNWVLILHMGIEGAAWSTLIALAMVSGWRVWYLWHRFRLWPYRWRTLFVPFLILSIGMVLQLFGFTGTAWLDMVLRSCAAALLYWPVVVLFRLAPEVVSYAMASIKR
ncbi:MAG: polysaccharide biosynthesis C-terminal domain-containing protein [Flavobacteriales bacterium]|nr:polysaccharide biosynthesis C-terminal domain-containing protein [Flavobacteriales bacterium]